MQYKSIIMNSLGGKIILFSVLLVYASEAFSCRLCNYLDMGTLPNKSNVSIFYQYSLYKGYNRIKPFNSIGTASDNKARIAHKPSTEFIVDKANRNYKTYNTYELRGNLNIADIFNLTLILPYENNKIYYSRLIDLGGITPVKDSLIQYAGWGRPIGLVEYHYEKISGIHTHILRPAIGINLARRETIVFNQSGFQTDHSIQTGAGLPEFFFRLVYRYMQEKSLISVSMIRGWSRENDPEYWYGRSFLLQLRYSYKFIHEGFKFVPEGSFTGVFQKPDLEYNKQVENTGGQKLMANLGAGLIYGKFALTPLIQIPFYQELKGEQLRLNSRITAQLTYQF